MLGIRYLSLTVITQKAIPGKWVFETSLLCTKCCLKIFHDLITADQTQVQPTKSVLQQDMLHYATLLVEEWTWSVYSDGISLEDIPCRQSKNKQPYPRRSNWNIRITVYMNIQNYIHKDGLFSIKSHTCTFLPSVVTGIISLHCLNDNNEKRFFFCLFVCFGGGKTFTQPSCRLYSCSWFEAIVANRKCGREVCLFFLFQLPFCFMSLSL